VRNWSWQLRRHDWLNLVKVVLDYSYLISLLGFVKGITTEAGSFHREIIGLTPSGIGSPRDGETGELEQFRP